MAAQAIDMCDLLNDDFGVEDQLLQEVASPPGFLVPQFSSDEAASEELRITVGGRPAAPRPPTPNPWDPRLVLDLALGIDALTDILERYGLDEAQYSRLTEVPSFRRELALTMREVRENGVSFAKKAAVQAESYLLNLDDMVHDAAVPASTRLDAIKSAVKWGRLEPKDEKGDGGASGTTVNLQINFT